MVRHGRRWKELAGTAAAVALVWLGAAAAPASAAVNDLGPIGFGAVAVDAAHGHVFVSGTSAGVVDELSYSGTLINQISVPGAAGMVINGPYLYVVASSTGTVMSIDLTAATPVATPLATGLNSPHWIATTGGALWVTEANPFGTGWGNIARVDPGTGQVTEFPGNSAMQMIYEPDLATSPGAPSTLFVAHDGQSPGQVTRVDVSMTSPAVTATSPLGDTSNIQGLAVSADGTRVIPAAGATQDASGYTHYQFLEYAGATLTADGVVYPAAPYPSAVATSGSGLVATGLDNGSLTGASGQSIADLNVFRLGSMTPTFWTTTANSSGDSNVRPHGVALDPAGTYLFAVTASDVYGTDTVFNSFPLSNATKTPPTITCGPAPSGWSGANVTIKCTATDNSGTGLVNPADASFSLSTAVASGLATTSAMTGTHTVCDNAGNCATAGPIGPISVDLAPPSVSCASAPAGWQAANVTLACTASDNGGSGLASGSDASFGLSTSVPAGSWSATAMTSTHSVCDKVGNCATAGPLGPVEVDLAPPTVTIGSPVNGSTVRAKSTLIANYWCADQGAGLAAGGCTGPVASGTALNTSKQGTYSFTVTARDLAGNTTTTTVTYTVSNH